MAGWWALSLHWLNSAGNSAAKLLVNLSIIQESLFTYRVSHEKVCIATYAGNGCFVPGSREDTPAGANNNMQQRTIRRRRVAAGRNGMVGAGSAVNNYYMKEKVPLVLR
jgi:hypothetical protein